MKSTRRGEANQSGENFLFGGVLAEKLQPEGLLAAAESRSESQLCVFDLHDNLISVFVQSEHPNSAAHRFTLRDGFAPKLKAYQLAGGRPSDEACKPR